MFHRVALIATLAALSFSSPALAGEYNEVLSLGDPAPAWKDLPGVDGKRHSLSDLEAEAVVVVFTCNSCPVATDYEGRIISLAKKYGGPSGKTAFVAINVNRIPDDSLPKMKERAEQRGFPFPYLYDESQEIAKAYGAAFTPEFFVLDKERRVAYMGGLDDNSNAQRVKTHYLEPAIQAILAGEKPETVETVAIGCRIRYVRQRSRKQP